MNTLEKQMMITQILTDNGWEVTDISMTGRCEIKANKRWSNISIYAVRCQCRQAENHRSAEDIVRRSIRCQC